METSKQMASLLMMLPDYHTLSMESGDALEVMGLPPVNKTLHDSDAWISSLCKKLDEWWSWVSCREEISKYKELDAISRSTTFVGGAHISPLKGDGIRIHDFIETQHRSYKFPKIWEKQGEFGLSFIRSNLC